MEALMSWAPMTVALGAMVACLVLNRRQEQYIRDHYPDEWERASRNPMRMRLPTARMLVLNESVRSGALAGQKDPLLQGLWFKQQALMWIGLVAILFNVVWSFVVG